MDTNLLKVSQEESLCKCNYFVYLPVVQDRSQLNEEVRKQKISLATLTIVPWIVLEIHIKRDGMQQSRVERRDCFSDNAMSLLLVYTRTVGV